MSDDWEKKYWANRANQVIRQKSQIHQEPNGKEIDAANLFSQRMVQSSNLPAKHINIKEGVQYYSAIPNEGFGGTTLLVRSMGPLKTQNTEFIYEGNIQAFCIDNLPQIDLAKLQQMPQKMLNLVKVKTFWGATILVEESAVIFKNPSRMILRG